MFVSYNAGRPSPTTRPWPCPTSCTRRWSPPDSATTAPSTSTSTRTGTTYRRASFADFTAHCHANGQKAGVYWGPFADWGKNPTAVVEGSSATYQQIWLRDGSGNPISVDGACAVDPTHPATQSRIDHFIGEFSSAGFDYVKLDFLTHGALESTARYDPSITTGIAAYNAGMKYIASRIGGSMFVSESIAPLFPYQYGQSRRVSCDTFGAATGGSSAEYELNSAGYGFWMSGHLYAYRSSSTATISRVMPDRPRP
jgi:hypothetical protein